MMRRAHPAAWLCAAVAAAALAVGAAHGALAAPPAAAAATAGPAAAPAQATPAAPPANSASALPATVSTPAAASASASADSARAPAPAYSGPTPMGGPSAGNLLQTILALCLVLGLLAALAWFLKRYGPKASGASANLRIVGALDLGGRERIIVVEVADQWIVVGAAPGRVNALATMARQEGAPSDPATVVRGAPAASFGDWLKQTMDKRHAN
ncbi:MAG: flagellar biosynthetic protein FliO [Pseudomonadota bacterium]